MYEKKEKKKFVSLKKKKKSLEIDFSHFEFLSSALSSWYTFNNISIKSWVSFFPIWSSCSFNILSRSIVVMTCFPNNQKAKKPKGPKIFPKNIFEPTLKVSFIISLILSASSPFSEQLVLAAILHSILFVSFISLTPKSNLFPLSTLENNLQKTCKFFLSNRPGPFKLFRWKKFRQAQFLDEPPIITIWGTEKSRASIRSFLWETCPWMFCEKKIMSFKYFSAHRGWCNHNALRETKAEIENRAILDGEVLQGFS